MRIAIVDNESQHTHSFEKVLPGHTIRVYKWDTLEQHRSSLATVDLIILSGSSKHAVVGKTGKEVYDIQRKIIKEAPVPLIGICAGFQLIAEVYGARLFVLPREERIAGIHYTHPLTDHPIFNKKKMVQVYKYHRWLVKTVPEDMTAHAKSDHGYDIVQHNKKMIWGFQFHPEVIKPENDGLQIMNNVLQMIADAKGASL